MPKEFERLIDSLLRVHSVEGSAGDLDVVRALALRDPRRPQQDSGRVADLPIEAQAVFDRAAEPQALPAELSQAIGTRGALLQRRTAFDQASYFSPAAENSSGLQSARAFGPFIEDGVLPVWFDLLLSAVRLQVRYGADVRPALLFTSARFTSSQHRITSGEGTVWIRADLLNSAATSNDYVGCKVRSGVYESAIAPTSASQDIVTFSAPPRAVLQLDLAQPVAPLDGRCDDIVIDAPTTLELRWGDAGLSLRLAGGRAGGPDGLELRFDESTQTRLDGRRLCFPATFAPTTISSAALSNAHAAFAGAVSIAEGGWSIPLTAAPDPALLPEAGGDAGWLLRLAQRFETRWLTLDETGNVQPDARLMIGQSRYEISGTVDRSTDASDAHRFELWSLEASRRPLPFDVELEDATPFAVGCHPSLGPYLRYEGTIAPRFDKPVDARNRPLQLARTPVHAMLHGSAEQRAVAVVPRGAELTWNDSATTLTLENAYLIVRATAFAGLTGSFGADRRILDGSLSIALRITNWIPTLPDPYVSNLEISRELFATRLDARAIAALSWLEALPTIRFIGSLESIVAQPKGVSPRLSRPAPAGTGNAASGLVAAGKQSTHERMPDERAATLREQEARFRHGLPQPSADGFRIEHPNRNPGALLLDVSTRRHQIGVAIRPRSRSELATGTTPRFVLDGMTAKTAVAAIDVIALPQVQWEPVYTLDKDQNPDIGWFPTPLASPDDGGPTLISSRAPTLVPVIPDVVLEEAVTRFRDAHDPISITTTLPFGIVAQLQLAPANTLLRRRDVAAFVRPTFATAPELVGALQLSVRAGGAGMFSPNREDPSFTGNTLQRLNGVDLATGAPLGVSVLGSTSNPTQSVESFFNQEFATGRPRVPLTRYDISGYGASTFSDWDNPNAAFGDASKVQFTVIVGRTTFEIVKINSKLYPWGISVTRSVTIERRGGGGVIRRDSGWQPTSDGLFDFRNGSAPSPYTFEPGLVEGIFEVRNIRPTRAADVALPDGGLVAPMYIDGLARIAGAAERVPVNGLLAFLHIRHRTPAVNPGQPITAKDFAALIERHAKRVGGPLETILNIGDSDFRGRATGIEIGVARVAGKPVFVGAVRVAPVFPPVGSWAAVRGPAPGQPPSDLIAVSDGVPIVRSGVIGAPGDGELIFAGPRGALLFSDPVDLHAGASPASDYGFLQATPTHRYLIRRPFVDPGVRELRSSLPHAMTDILTATTSKGFFPPIERAIQLTDRPYTLRVAPVSGRLRLDPKVSLPSPRTDLIVSSDGSSQMRLDYSASTLIFELDETHWHFELPRLFARCDGLGTTDLCNLELEIIGGTTVRPQMRNLRGALYKDIEELLSIVPGFGDRPSIGPVDLGATNLDLSTKVTFELKKEQTFGVPPIRLIVEAFVKMAFQVEAEHPSAAAAITATATSPVGAAVTTLASGVDSCEWSVAVGFGMQLRLYPPPVYPAFIMIGCEGEVGYKAKFKSDADPEGQLFTEVTIFLGYGAENTILCFVSECWLAIGLRFIAEGSDRGVGGVVMFMAKVDMVIVHAEVSGEFSGLCITKADGRKATKYAGELAIYVEVAWIFSIELSAELSEEDEV